MPITFKYYQILTDLKYFREKMYSSIPPEEIERRLASACALAEGAVHAYDNGERRANLALKVLGHSRRRYELGFSWKGSDPVTVDDVAENLAMECPAAFSRGSDGTRDYARRIINDALSGKIKFGSFWPLGSIIFAVIFPPSLMLADSVEPRLLKLDPDPGNQGAERYQIVYLPVDSAD